MITIIFGPPRIGKTAFMVHQLNIAAFDYERNRAMQKALEFKNANGFNLTIPKHCASANFDIRFRKPGYYPREARIIDPKKLGFGGPDRKTHFLLPYETIGIMEAQEFFNSRRYSEFEPWQSNLFEQHGHNNLRFLLDTQRPGLIDKNIREISNFIEIRSLDVVFDKKQWFKHMTWTIREFDNSGAVDEYMRSGKQDRSLYTQTKVTSQMNILKSYDSWSLEPKFYAGHLDDDFDIERCKSFGPTKDDYRQYLQDIESAA